jgi:hypothetical protein
VTNVEDVRSMGDSGSICQSLHFLLPHTDHYDVAGDMIKVSASDWVGDLF